MTTPMFTDALMMMVGIIFLVVFGNYIPPLLRVFFILCIMLFACTFINDLAGQYITQESSDVAFFQSLLDPIGGN